MDARAEMAKADEEKALEYINQIYNAAHTGSLGSSHLLTTDDRVLARVTDGIYRQPASAIRELIVNAYDADATEAVVLTDAPRYSQILVRDNGNGMTAGVLVNLIQHIGGSANERLRGNVSASPIRKTPE